MRHAHRRVRLIALSPLTLGLIVPLTLSITVCRQLCPPSLFLQSSREKCACVTHETGFHGHHRAGPRLLKTHRLKGQTVLGSRLSLSREVLVMDKKRLGMGCQGPQSAAEIALESAVMPSGPRQHGRTEPNQRNTFHLTFLPSNPDHFIRYTHTWKLFQASHVKGLLSIWEDNIYCHYKKVTSRAYIISGTSHSF